MNMTRHHVADPDKRNEAIEPSSLVAHFGADGLGDGFETHRGFLGLTDG